MLFNSNGSIEKDLGENLSTEAQSLIMECAMLDELSTDEIHAFLENSIEVGSALKDQVLLERTIVRLDKKAKLTKAQKMAVFTIAKEKNDPKFKKLLTIWRMERFLEAFLMKKYGNEAMRRAKKAMYNGQHSSSSIVKKVANNVHSQLNGSVLKK